MFRQLRTALACAALGVASGPIVAKADVVEVVKMTFASGATFTGLVTLANDFSYVVSVTGILKGYQDGSQAYMGRNASDAITWVWNEQAHVNYSTGQGNFSTYLMDGDGATSTYSNWIQIAYNYSTAPGLTLTSGVSFKAEDNYLDGDDAMVHGSIEPLGAPSSGAPEISTWAMMLAGFAGMAFVADRQVRRRAALAV